MRVEGYLMHLYCDVEGCAIPQLDQGFQVIDGCTKAEATKQARLYGWTLGKRDLCPKHTKEKREAR